jgi:hypothetical protein
MLMRAEEKKQAGEGENQRGGVTVILKRGAGGGFQDGG